MITDAGKYKGIGDAFSTIMKQETWRGFYRGNSMNVMRIGPQGAIAFFAKDRLYEAHLVPRVKWEALARAEFAMAGIIFVSSIAMAVTITEKNCTLPHQTVTLPGGPCICLKVNKGILTPVGCSRSDPARFPPLSTGMDGGKLGTSCGLSFLGSLAFFTKALFSYSQSIKGDGNGGEFYAGLPDTSEKPYNLAYDDISEGASVGEGYHDL